MECLAPTERTRLEALKEKDLWAKCVWDECARILGSRRFARVRQESRDFLLFVVAKTLLGQEDEIKEVTVAIQVFGKGADFDPAESSLVRESAKNLREKLAEYYDGEGERDPIRIMLHQGSYVPEIRDCRLKIALSSFHDWNPNDDERHLCRTMTDEIAHQLERSGPVEVVRVNDPVEAVPTFQYGLRGSLECEGTRLRVNASLSNLQTVLWGRTFSGPRTDILRLSAEIVRAVMNELRDPERFSESPTALARPFLSPTKEASKA